MLNLYCKYREVPADSWPPVGTGTFINLALTRCKNQCADFIDYGGEPYIKEKVEYAEVFGEYESGALILVEGFPGTGKTTLTQKIVKDWARGITLKKAKVVLLVPLTMLSLTNKDQTLTDILGQLFHNQKRIQKLLLEEVENCGSVLYH